MWFEIKTALSCKDGVRHVYSTILKSRYLTDDLKKLKKVVDPVIQGNAFFSHPENLLLAMLTDERQAIGLRDGEFNAMRRIIKTRRLDTETEFARYPCHTQTVERHIKLVTEASVYVGCSESRDGFIRARLGSRWSKMPKFDKRPTSSVAVYTVI